ncbi:Spore protein SP21 [bacterium HR18]|nr:Spore protein SP21 [bacterium HR18]
MTSLVRFAPMAELRRLQQEMDRLFDTFFGREAEATEEAPVVWVPRADLAETEDAYLIHLDLPGMNKEELSITYQDGTLAVSGERKTETKEEKANFVRLERSYGRFYRSFTLPKAVDDKRIEAKYENGVLTIRLPKAEASKARRIEIG